MTSNHDPTTTDHPDGNKTGQSPTPAQSSTDTFDIDALEKTYPDYQGQIAYTKHLPAEDADTVPAEDVLSGRLAAKFPHDLYTHQANALNTLEDGNNVVVSTSTSSGKTMVYALQIARNALDNPDSTALLVYPTKALSRDQEQALNDLYNDLGIDINVSVYDGDTTSNRRKYIRDNSDIIITNFSGVNTYLHDHSLWNTFYSDIELIAIDESHSYTGIHGMHVAWTLRRLRRVIDYYDADPQFVLTSATIGNPSAHSKALTGVDVEVIDDDGSPTGQRNIVFWEPPKEYTDDPDDTGADQKPAGQEASEVVTHLAYHDLQTLMFTRSRKETEINANRARSALSDYPSTKTNDIDIESYNAGHGKKTRRGVENRLKDGNIDGVITTNALELGIDIGSVDAAVLAGYPGTRQSFWQQLGRAGRGTQSALGVYVPRHDSIDDYILKNPEYILKDDNIEDAVVDLNNNFVFARHLLCASEELPLTRDDAQWFDAYRMEDAADMWRKAGLMVGTLDGGVQYDGPPRPQQDISMYATTDTQFQVRCEDCDVDIEPIDKERAYRDYHEGAIVLHKGQQYEVIDFNEDTPQPSVTITPVDVTYYTQSLSDTRISDLEVEKSRQLTKHTTLHWGTGTVSITYDKYKKKNLYTGKEESMLMEIDLPPIEMETQLMWFTFDQPLIDDLKEQYGDAETRAADAALGGLHALEHGIISMAPLELRMDKNDLGGLSQLHHPELDNSAAVFVYDGVSGGVGFAKAIYDTIDTILEKTHTSITTCDCTGPDGCPACVMDDNCGDNNEPLHTIAATHTIETIGT